MYEILHCLAFLEFLSHINFPNIVGKSTALAQSPQYFLIGKIIQNESIIYRAEVCHLKQITTTKNGV